MKNLNLKIFAIIFSIALSGCAAEHVLVKEFNQLTENCEKKNPEDWLKQLNQLEHNLYEQAYEMPKDEFKTHFLGQTSNLDDEGDLYWAYMLYGAPYIKIQQDYSMLSNLASSCYIYLHDFEKALAKLDYKSADAEINNWQSCLWTWFHKPQPAADDFKICYQAIPKYEEGRAKFVISPVEIEPVEGAENYFSPARQHVELYIKNPNDLEKMTISTFEDINDDTTLERWVVRRNESRISKLSDQHLYFSYQDKVVFSTKGLPYDYINFKTVCTGKDKTQQLLFSMITGGTASGEIQDMLFVYYDAARKEFTHQIT